MPRASSLTDALQKRIVDGIRAGLHVARAAEAAGISDATFYRWMKQGDPIPDPNEPDLANMSLTELRRLCKLHKIPANTRTSRATMTEALERSDVGSWARYRRFREAVEEAEAELEARLVAQWQLTMQPITRKERLADGTEVEVIVKHANHKSASDFLARRFPQRWSPTVAIEISGRDGGPIVTREERAEEVADWLERIQAGVPEEETVVEVESKAMGE